MMQFLTEKAANIEKVEKDRMMRAIHTAHRSSLGICVFLCTILLSAHTVKCATGSGGQSSALTVVETEVDEGDDVASIQEEQPDDMLSDFEPTDEWQDVKEGQKLPPGLHVQMDFQTGRKQARRMAVDEDDGKPGMKKWDAGDDIGVINTKEPRYTRDELQAALKDFKYQDVHSQEQNPEDSVQGNFRSYEELKQAMKDMQLAVKTETEIVQELTARLNQSLRHESEETRTVLIDLEYYLHQIDNAQVFCDLGGMGLVLRLMNSTAEDVRESVSHMLGAALQSNARAQVAAVEAGVLSNLVRGLATEASRNVQKKLLYATSALLRQFPHAQLQFVQQGGLSVLAQLVQHAEDRAIQVKVVTLITDLITESDFNTGDASATSDEVQTKRSQQYAEIQLRSAVSSMGWCTVLPSLLQQDQGQGYSQHDRVEKVVQAMTALSTPCRQHFSPARSTLQALMHRYSQLAQHEEDGDFFSEIFTSLQTLVGQIYREDL